MNTARDRTPTTAVTWRALGVASGGAAVAEGLFTRRLPVSEQ